GGASPRRGSTSGFRARRTSFMGGYHSLGRQTLRQPLARAAEPHVNGGGVDGQQFSDFVGVIIQCVPQSQDFAVRRRQLFQHPAQLREGLLSFQRFQRQRVVGLHPVHRLRRGGG